MIFFPVTFRVRAERKRHHSLPAALDTVFKGPRSLLRRAEKNIGDLYSGWITTRMLGACGR